MDRREVERVSRKRLEEALDWINALCELCTNFLGDFKNFAQEYGFDNDAKQLDKEGFASLIYNSFLGLYGSGDGVSKEEIVDVCREEIKRQLHLTHLFYPYELTWLYIDKDEKGWYLTVGMDEGIKKIGHSNGAYVASKHRICPYRGTGDNHLLKYYTLPTLLAIEAFDCLSYNNKTSSYFYNFDRLYENFEKKIYHLNKADIVNCLHHKGITGTVKEALKERNMYANVTYFVNECKGFSIGEGIDTLHKMKKGETMYIDKYAKRISLGIEKANDNEAIVSFYLRGDKGAKIYERTFQIDQLDDELNALKDEVVENNQWLNAEMHGYLAAGEYDARYIREVRHGGSTVDEETGVQTDYFYIDFDSRSESDVSKHEEMQIYRDLSARANRRYDPEATYDFGVGVDANGICSATLYYMKGWHGDEGAYDWKGWNEEGCFSVCLTKDECEELYSTIVKKTALVKEPKVTKQTTEKNKKAATEKAVKQSESFSVTPREQQLNELSDKANSAFATVGNTVRNHNGYLVNDAWAECNGKKVTIHNHSDSSVVVELRVSYEGKPYVVAKNFDFNESWEPRKKGEPPVKVFINNERDLKEYIELPEIREVVAEFKGFDKEKQKPKKKNNRDYGER